MSDLVFTIAGSHQGQRKMGVETGFTAVMGQLPEDIITNDLRESYHFDKPIYGSYLLGKSMLQTSRNHSLGDKSIFFTVGGCHTITFGTYYASSTLRDDIHLIWIDAHPDINTPASSYSGNCHGMPMAYIMGLVHSKKMTGLKNLNPSRVAYIGLRCIDDDEEIFLQKLKTDGLIRFSAQDVKQNGINSIINSIENHWKIKEANKNTDKDSEVIEKNTVQIHISLDIDSMDPEFTPATGTPVPDGLQPDDVKEVIRWANNVSSLRKCHLDITEINPYLASIDGVNKTYKTVKEIVDVYL